MSTYIIDIETRALPIESLPEPELKIDSRLKDPQKIELARKEARDEWVSKLALHPETATVLAVGISNGTELTLGHGNDEAKNIEAAWDIIGIGNTIIGHNIQFDISFLLKRSWILGIKTPPNIRKGKWLDRRFVCTMDTWTGGEGRISLDNLARILKVGQKSGSGAQFAETYEKDQNAALAYLANDLNLTVAIARRMGLI